MIHIDTLCVHGRRRAFWICGLLLAGGLFACEATFDKVPEIKTNVLFIVVDDLRPALGCYGDRRAITPNIDRLAREGILFSRAYCQQAICSPSRTSLMLGLRPDSTGVHDLDTHFRTILPDVVTLPQRFKEYGYQTQSIGKVYHSPTYDDPLSWTRWSSYPRSSTDDPETDQEVIQAPDAPQASEAPEESPASLTSLEFQTSQESYESQLQLVLEAFRGLRDPQAIVHGAESIPKRVFGASWEALEVDDSQLADGKIADEAITVLRRLKGQPFFLAVGFMKPHLPFVAPKKYFDLHRDTPFEVAQNAFRPKGAPDFAGTPWRELRKYTDIPKQGGLSETKQLELIKAYYAAVTFVDAQIGRILDALEAEGLRENTAIVLWGDHGWHLGDHAQWAKSTNWEKALHSPLIFSSPGMKQRGIRSDALVEFVDVYPTLVELCGLPLPEGLEGVSLEPLFENPLRTWKKGAFSQYPREGTGLEGYSVRTERYRLTEWRDEAGETKATELYDYQNDPEENTNWATDENYTKVLQEMRSILHGGWQKALPPGG